jgi:catalase
VAPRGGAQAHAGAPAPRDFVADAFAHCQFIGYSPEAKPLLTKAGVEADGGCKELRKGEAADFVGMLGKLRYWERGKG